MEIQVIIFFFSDNFFNSGLGFQENVFTFAARFGRVV